MDQTDLTDLGNASITLFQISGFFLRRQNQNSDRLSRRRISGPILKYRLDKRIDRQNGQEIRRRKVRGKYHRLFSINKRSNYSEMNIKHLDWRLV